MRFLLLLVLLAAFGYLVHQHRQDRYPFTPIVTPTARAFDTYLLPDQCDGSGMCIRQVAYLTELQDTAAIKEEARLLLAWAEQRPPHRPAPTAAAVIAVRPGFLRLAPPKSAHFLTFALLRTGTDWQYVDLEDKTAELAKLFQ
jgi:hypothetical protein